MSSDQFVSSDLQYLAKAVEEHDHSSGLGLGVKRLQTSATPTASGHVQITGDSLKWWGASAAAVKTATDLDSSQTMTNKTLTSPIIAASTMSGTHTVSGTLSSSGGTISGSWAGTPTFTGDVRFNANVGLGMAPVQLLDMTKATNGQVSAQINNTTSGTLAYAEFHAVAGTSNGLFQVFSQAFTPVNHQLASGANLEASGAGGLSLAATNASGVIRFYAGGTTEVARITTGGSLFIGSTSNAKMTAGVTVNQGAADDEIFSAKSSDVAHGMTTDTETNTFLAVDKHGAATGGARFRGYTSGSIGVSMYGVEVTEDTTKATTSSGAIIFIGQTKSGTAGGAKGSTSNLAAFANHTTTEFILRSDGTPYQHAGTAWTNFDSHDDVALLTAASAVVSRPGDPFAADWRDLVKEHRATLERTGLVVINDQPGGDGSVFWSLSGFIQLAVGGVRQVGGRVTALERELSAIKKHPALAGA